MIAVVNRGSGRSDVPGQVLLTLNYLGTAGAVVVSASGNFNSPVPRNVGIYRDGALIAAADQWAISQASPKRYGGALTWFTVDAPAGPCIYTLRSIGIYLGWDGISLMAQSVS